MSSFYLRPKDAEISKNSGVTQGEERKIQEERRYSSESGTEASKEKTNQLQVNTSSAKRREKRKRKRLTDMSEKDRLLGKHKTGAGGGESSGQRLNIQGISSPVFVYFIRHFLFF